MRVIFNQSPALGVRTGVGQYTSELLRCLKAQTGDVRIVPYPNHGVWWARKLWSHLVSELPRGRQPSNPETPSLVRPRPWLGRIRAWGQAALERQQSAVFFDPRYDLYHEPNHIPLPSDRPTLTSVHDLSALLHPDWHPRPRVRYFEHHFPRSLTQSVHFLAVSEFTRQEMIEVIGIAPARITRVYNGVRPSCRPLPPDVVARRLRRLGLPAQYLLFVGTVEPRKNVLRLLQAFCGLPQAVREKWPLLLAGPWGWCAEPIASYYHARARACGARHLGYVSDRDLAVLYNGARALVYPSHYEGFGLPVAEMLACGGAVITSTAAALREIATSAAFFVDPEDEAGWRYALLRVVSQDDWWRDLRRGAAAQAGRFTWEQSAAETLHVYRALAKAREQPATAPRRAA
jgi:glycosyltransferase involved in cell wall biosynthesis